MRRSIPSMKQGPFSRSALAVLVAALALGGAAQARSAAPPAPAAGAVEGAAPAVGAAGTAVAVPARRTAAAPSARDVAAVRPARRPPRARAQARASATAHTAATAGVTISDFRFGPAAIVVHVGDTVTWSNEGPSDHTATGAGFDSGVLRQGASASHTFATAGTFSYHCTIHPFMKGTVTVLASAASAAPSGSGAPSSSGAAAPSTAGTPSASGASATATAAAPSGRTLPRTGLDARALALGGLLSLALGVLLRRLIERR
jgi:plastocyanin